METPQAPHHTPQPPRAITRRGFIQSAAASGAGLMLNQLAFAQAPTSPTTNAAPSAPAILQPGAAGVINIGIIGVGAMGRVLIDAAKGIPNVRFKAVCDIWDYNRTYGLRYLKAYKHAANAYLDYREMLDKEKELHAVLVATPDWMHAEHAIACLQAGLHVYLEKPLANTPEDARRIVLAQRASDKLVQVGFQRRSNPRYLFALKNVLRTNKLLGRVGQINAQWNRFKSDDMGWPRDREAPPGILRKYGYPSMHHFRNWRWYKKFGGGPVLDLASHQVDVMNWFLDATPKSVVATGGVDYDKKHECYDTLMGLLEYNTPTGPVRASYQALTTSSYGKYYETFIGDEGALVMSENAQFTRLFREPISPTWHDRYKDIVTPPPNLKRAQSSIPGVLVETSASPDYPEEFQMTIKMNDPYHRPHLVNFFDAIRNGAALNCPVETGYASTMTALAINKAIETGEKIRFKPEDFKFA